MCLLQLFCLSFQNKLAACVQKQRVPKISVYFLPTFMLSRLWARECLKHLLHCYGSTRFYGLCLHKCSGMWTTACGSWVLSFLSQSQKSHGCIRRESRPKLVNIARKFSRGDAHLGGLRPLNLPAAHLPPGHLGFWVSVGNTVFKQLPSRLSRYDTSNRWRRSNHVADAPRPPRLFSCLQSLSHLSQPGSKNETNKCAFAFFR